MTWMRTFTTKESAVQRQTEKRELRNCYEHDELRCMGMGIPEPSLLGMKWDYKKWEWRQELCLFVVLRTLSQIIHRLAFTRSIDHDHR